MFRLASLTEPAIRYSPTKFFSSGVTNIVRAIIMFPIPGTYVSNIYAHPQSRERLIMRINICMHGRNIMFIPRIFFCPVLLCGAYGDIYHMLISVIQARVHLCQG